MSAWFTIIAVSLYITTIGSRSQTQPRMASNTDFDFSSGEVPNPFLLYQHYLDRPESVECRPIRLRISRGSPRFLTDLVTNDHAGVLFADADSRIMSNRMERRLNELAELFYADRGVWITVTKAWTEQDDQDPVSLHFEGS